MIEFHSLPANFLGTGDIAQRAKRVGSSAGDLVIGYATLLPDAVHLGINIRVVVGIHETHFGSHQMLQKLVSEPLRHTALFQNQDGFHSQLPGCGRGQHSMV